MLKEFKEFAMKGNVVDMAVGIIIGSALAVLGSPNRWRMRSTAKISVRFDCLRLMQRFLPLRG